jgi:hypothetical protein
MIRISTTSTKVYAILINGYVQGPMVPIKIEKSCLLGFIQRIIDTEYESKWHKLKNIDFMRLAILMQVLK